MSKFFEKIESLLESASTLDKNVKSLDNKEIKLVKTMAKPFTLVSKQTDKLVNTEKSVSAYTYNQSKQDPRASSLMTLMKRSNEIVTSLDSGQDNYQACITLTNEANQIWNEIEQTIDRTLTFKEPIGEDLLKAIRIFWAGKADALFDLSGETLAKVTEASTVKCLGVPCDHVEYRIVDGIDSLYCAKVNKMILNLQVCPDGNWDKRSIF
jgi:hypothetical protein